jgi:pimeloyl-ACP methyl ester carboxylesterase
MKTREALFALAAMLGGLAGAVAATRVAQAYRRDQRVARAQLLALSTVTETARGPVEYGEYGHGPAVLVSHGGGGGFDQGLHSVRFLGDSAARFIAPSRFGYLRTRLPANPTPEAQADTFAALLDALGIERAAMLGISAGGMSALQFALRHPDRCWGLILISAISSAVTLGSVVTGSLAEAVFGNDFPFWAMSTYLPGVILASVGYGADDDARLASEPEARRGMLGVIRFDPISHRRDGLLNDLIQAEVLPEAAFERIQMPALIIHGTADPSVPFHIGARAAAHLPSARLLKLEGGGHLAWFTRAAETRPAALEFIATHAPRE